MRCLWMLPMNGSKAIASGFFALGLMLGCVSQAKADLTYTLNDTAHQVSATAVFSVVAGGIEITVTNTESNTQDAGHAISQIQFTVGGALGRPSAFTEIAGTTTNFAGTTAHIDVTPPASTQHWLFSTPSNSTVDLFDVNGYGGQPNHLIVAAGSTPNASLTNTHTPSFIGAVNFFLSDSTLPNGGNLTLSDITGVRFAFGTNLEVPLEAATESVAAAPELSSMSMVLGVAGVLGAIGLVRRWRHGLS